MMDANYLNGLTSEQLKRKADQHWDMAWLARQDNDPKDVAAHTEKARAYQAALGERL